MAVHRAEELPPSPVCDPWQEIEPIVLDQAISRAIERTAIKRVLS